MRLRWLLLLALVPGPLSAQREPVLKQVKVPHNYYYREMYLPQLTTGPGSVSWSPDGTELVYSMQGTLWRQRIGSDTAVQLTDGGGYDYQPDWSPDGRRVLFARYRDDAIELMSLDLATGSARPITSGGHVNVEPRWSPDGGRVAFVSTRHEGRWHLHVASWSGDSLAGVERISEDRDSGLPRYYYSRFDHYISPSWSPDGRELVLVSNRGATWGSGGFWRMEARPGAPMRLLHDEETTWKARPDWAPDGRRVVYSSYLGRQRNQLWLMTSDGANPVQLTYGDFDATAPRWSPEGRRIAYVSNERGTTSLMVLEIPGGARQEIRAPVRRYRNPTGTLRISIREPGGTRAAPARVSVTLPDGRTAAPESAWVHADDSFDRRQRRFEYGYFHTEDQAVLTVPAGRVTVEVTRGPEYQVVRQEVEVASGRETVVRARPARIRNLAARGWTAGDLHVHMNYGGAYRATPRTVLRQARAEGVHVVENLVVNKETRVPDIAWFTGRPDPVSTDSFLLAHDQEFHTSVWGHMGVLGLRDNLLLPDYSGYANTALASLYPDNATVSTLARRQGALVGYVHPFDEAPDPGNRAVPLTNALPVDAALGKLDYYELMGFSDHRATAGVWYRLLNTGIRLPAGAGTDAMTNFASLRGPLGTTRVYVRSGFPLDHRRWLEALRAGRTFVTNGPLLEFAAGDSGIGSEVRLPRPGRVAFQVSLRSYVPVDHLEIVRNGEVVASIPLRGERTAADTTVQLDVHDSGWYILRAWNDAAREPVLDLYPYSSTSPVYVTVGGRPIRSREDAEFFLAWLDRLDEAAGRDTSWNDDLERSTVLSNIAQARLEFERRRDQALQGAPRATRAIRAGWLLDVERGRVLRDRVILLAGNRILAIRPDSLLPDDIPVDDLRGHTVLPGLIDLHAHLVGDLQSNDPLAPLATSRDDDMTRALANARATLLAGFTTVRDIGAYRAFVDVALRDTIVQHGLPGPRMAVSGPYVTIRGGGGEVTGDTTVRIPDEMRRGVANGTGEVRRRVREILAAGADYIKMIVTGAVLTQGTEPGESEYSEAEIRAAVEEAEAAGTYVAAHAHGAEGIRRAVRAGVRTIEHGSLVDREGIDLMRERGTWLVADIFNGDYIESEGRRAGWPEEIMRKNAETTDAQRAGFRSAVAAGVRIGYGTDSGVYPHAMGTAQLPYMVRYGLSPMQTLQAATINAARAMGWDDQVGSLAPGKLADIVAVPGNLLAQLQELAGRPGGWTTIAVPFVMKDGVVYGE